MTADGFHRYQIGKTRLLSTELRDAIEELADLDPATKRQLRWSDSIPGFEVDDSVSSGAPSQDLSSDDEVPDLETDTDDDAPPKKPIKRKSEGALPPKKQAKKESSKKKREESGDDSDSDYDAQWSWVKCLNRSLRPVAAVKPEERVQVQPASLLPVLNFLPPIPALENESEIEKVCYGSM
jgi:hypothetical protein